MAGKIHGEVLDVTRRLRELGLSRNAVDALTVIAEGCRAETRTGSCSRDRIADKLYGVARTATRAITELRERGLIEVVIPGGGHGRSAVVTVYRIVDLAAWLHDRGDTQVSPRPQPPAKESAGQPDVPPTTQQPLPADVPPTSRRDISGQSAGHPGVAPPVVLPVKDLVEALDVTTRPRANDGPAPRARPRPQVRGQLPLAALVRDPSPDPAPASAAPTPPPARPRVSYEIPEMAAWRERLPRTRASPLLAPGADRTRRRRHTA